MLRWLIAVVVVLAAAWVWKDQSTSSAGGEAGLTKLAASVRADEIVIYTTSTCPYCKQALRWLDQQGFSYTECNMSTTPRCEKEFLSHGGNGTPYLIVRGHHMKDGFDSDEFQKALK